MFKSFRFRAAMLLSVFTLAVMGVLSLALGALVEREQTRDQGDALHVLARAAGTAMAEGLYERMREIELLAASPELNEAALTPQIWQPVLDRMQRTRPNYAWIGLTDARGTVLAATGGLLQGADVSQRPWFEAGRRGAWAGDVHTAKLLATLLPALPGGEPLRFIDFAAPVHDVQGRLLGVISAHGSWRWAQDVVGAMRLNQARERGVQIFILDRHGLVIHHPPGPYDTVTLARGAVLPLAPGRPAWSDGSEFLTVAVPVPAHSATTALGWTVVVRQPLETALATANHTRELVLWAGAAAGLAVMLLTWLVTGRYGRALERISASALRIEAGDLSAAIPRSGESIEFVQLSDALRGMTQTLIERKQTLELANATLEARVSERTHELECANRQLEQLALRDGLTGLFNRRAFDQRLGDEMARHRRSGNPLTVMLLDVDHFKRINDTHGHDIGDLVLVQLGRCLVSACRATDFVARFGGEEFVVLMPETGVEGAMAAAEKLRLAVMTQTMPGPVMHITVSIGVCSPASERADPNAAVKAADEALYAAKRAGRNRVALHGAPLAVEAEEAATA